MAFEFSILAAFGAMACWGIGDFLIQRGTRRVGDIETLAFIGILGAIGLLPVVLPELPLLFSPANFGLLIVLGVVTFVAAIFDFEALREGKLCVIEVILEIELPVTAILAFIFFGETLTMVQLAIVLLIFLGIILMAIDPFSHRKARKVIEKGVVLAILAAVGMAAVNFLTAAGSKQVSPIMAIWVPWLVIGIMSIVVIWRGEGLRKFRVNAAKFKWLIIAMAIFDTAAWLFYATAVLKNEIAITTAITESYPAIGLFLGVWFNKEKIFKHQYLGAALALVASVLLAFFV
ncbi:MAG: DMT family transporter [Candidatus Diapherotrites archaeon]|nr:DMT family transporter [Candidatus Diapherotrites archaeon]